MFPLEGMCRPDVDTLATARPQPPVVSCVPLVRRFSQSAAGVLVSNRVTLSNSAVMIAVADSVEGDVRVQVKPQVAVVFGAAFSTALAVTLLLGRRSR